MRSVATAQTFAATVADAERCWYDTGGWPGWVDGLDRVIATREPWPLVGGSVVWESGPAGRGTVTETVTAYAPSDGQTVEVIDDSVTGRQTVAFVPAQDGVEVTFRLEYRFRRFSPITLVVDVLFIRRQMSLSLNRTLDRFGTRLRHAA